MISSATSFPGSPRQPEPTGTVHDDSVPQPDAFTSGVRWQDAARNRFHASASSTGATSSQFVPGISSLESRPTTVLDVKNAIADLCPGHPRVSGQRLIWRGRTLEDDERLIDLWQSPSEPRVVHLAVHSSAWTSEPPNRKGSAANPSSTPLASAYSQASSSSSSTYPQPPLAIPTTPSIRPPFVPMYHIRSPAPPAHPLAFVRFRHDQALSVLSEANPTVPYGTQFLDEYTPVELRDAAAIFVNRAGYVWPSILDISFPLRAPGGIRYEYAAIEGQPYLKLVDCSMPPTPRQTHAITVLTYTFTLLGLSEPTVHRVTSSQNPLGAAPDINSLLQQLGLPPIHRPPRNVVNHVPVNEGIRAAFAPPELRGFAIWSLFSPMIWLIARTLLLLYLFDAGQAPIYGGIILVLMLYEMWSLIRNLLTRGPIDARRQQGRNGANAGGAGQNAADDADINDVFGVRLAQRGENNALVGALAEMNIAADERALFPAEGEVVPEPSFVSKVTNFALLLVGTVYPALWDQRRTALRRREGTLRTEARAREEAVEEGEDPNGERARARENIAQVHERRPHWVRDYIDRVVADDWVDNAE
ncbi:hypothetical protein FISHEDRAFT_46938 [Fistulina hepatica ATCC 64428]|uniref:Ubiquitin-like domain-containing protein n=1 Tax=Fistulina hepatica ATCC 64428 TaxID=1128425 RepID=A0A0D7A9H8_9AGAR|nr:hypothetical protein FISHEDRAFT_46938 [Fistulina hepatica ATCC 64428]